MVFEALMLADHHFDYIWFPEEMTKTLLTVISNNHISTGVGKPSVMCTVTRLAFSQTDFQALAWLSLHRMSVRHVKTT